jgi:hypothetical protein
VAAEMARRKNAKIERFDLIMSILFLGKKGEGK